MTKERDSNTVLSISYQQRGNTHYANLIANDESGGYEWVTDDVELQDLLNGFWFYPQPDDPDSPSNPGSLQRLADRVAAGIAGSIEYVRDDDRQEGVIY